MKAPTRRRRALHTWSYVSGWYLTWSRYRSYLQPYQRIYLLLQVWQETGFVWEQYNSVDGKGKGCYPFTGWSALIAEIILERYVRIG